MGLFKWLLSWSHPVNISSGRQSEEAPQFLLQETGAKYLPHLLAASAEYDEAVTRRESRIKALNAEADKLLARDGNLAQRELNRREALYLQKEAWHLPHPVKPTKEDVIVSLRREEVLQIVQFGRWLFGSVGEESIHKGEGLHAKIIKFKVARRIMRFCDREFLVVEGTGDGKEVPPVLRATDSMQQMTNEELQAIVAKST